MQSYRPFRLTVRLCSPIIPTAFIPLLDGLLWGAWVRATGQAPSESELPLARSDGVYRASGMIVACGLEPVDTISWTQSIARDAEEVPPAFLAHSACGHLRAGEVSKGAFKNASSEYTMMLPHPNKIGPSGGWYVHFFGVGDGARCASLLRHLPGIGRKASRGFGTISRDTDAVVAHPIGEDCSWIRDGRPMRPLPVTTWRNLPGANQDWPSIIAAVAPPYGTPRRIRCVAPDGYCLSAEDLP